MKNIRISTCLIFIVFFYLSGSSQDWNKQESNITTDLLDLFFINSEVGFAVGENWFLLQDYGLVGACTGMCFASQTDGYAIGWRMGQGYYWSSIHKTTNGGIDWSASGGYKEEDITFSSVFFLNDEIGVVAGSNGKILITRNAGKNWVNSITPVDEDLTSAFITGPEIGYAVGANGTILKTNSGGLAVAAVNERKSSIDFYPNPVLGMLHIDISDDFNRGSEILVYSITGALVQRFQLVEKENILDLSNLLKGIYFVKLIDNERSIDFSFVKQ